MCVLHSRWCRLPALSIGGISCIQRVAWPHSRPGGLACPTNGWSSSPALCFPTGTSTKWRCQTQLCRQRPLSPQDPGCCGNRSWEDINICSNSNFSTKETPWMSEWVWFLLHINLVFPSMRSRSSFSGSLCLFCAKKLVFCLQPLEAKCSVLL